MKLSTFDSNSIQNGSSQVVEIGDWKFLVERGISSYTTGTSKSAQGASSLWAIGMHPDTPNFQPSQLEVTALGNPMAHPIGPRLLLDDVRDSDFSDEETGWVEMEYSNSILTIRLGHHSAIHNVCLVGIKDVKGLVAHNPDRLFVEELQNGADAEGNRAWKLLKNDQRIGVVRKRQRVLYGSIVSRDLSADPGSKQEEVFFVDYGSSRDDDVVSGFAHRFYHRIELEETPKEVESFLAECDED